MFLDVPPAFPCAGAEGPVGVPKAGPGPCPAPPAEPPGPPSEKPAPPPPPPVVDTGPKALGLP